MNIGEGLALIVVPFVTFGLGLLTTAMTRRDFRANLKADVDTLNALPNDSRARVVLMESVNQRVEQMVADDKRRISFGVLNLRSVYWLMGIGAILIIGGNIVLAVGVNDNRPVFVTTFSAVILGSGIAIASGLLAFALLVKWVIAWGRSVPRS